MKKSAVLFFCISLLITLAACQSTNPSTENDNTTSHSFVNNNIVQIGNIVEFGNFEQDGNLANGLESLRWIVISKKEENCLLLCENVITPLKYSDEDIGNAWENSYVYDWLNNEFLYTAFSPNQMNQLQHETIVSEYFETINEYYNNEPIFILSVNELNYFSSVVPDSKLYLCYPTVYAEQTDNSYIHNSDTYLSKYKGMAEFWTRPLGSYASINGPRGGFELQGYGDSIHGVRPALWVKMSALQ